MAKRTEQEIRERSDGRQHGLQVPCMHCKHVTTIGSQFGSEGWSCPAYPEKINYRILTLRDPHTEAMPDQKGALVFTPKVYIEDETGREWHYNADGTWQYADA